MSQLELDIAGIRMSFEPADGAGPLARPRDAHARFLVESGGKRPDMRLVVSAARPEPRPPSTLVAGWETLFVYAIEDGFRFEFVPEGATEPLKCLEMSTRTWEGRAWFRPDYLEAGGPCDTQMTELATLLWLGGHDGLELHACAIDDGGRGLIFAGHSGAGKSTTSRLWADAAPDARVLTDDRVILRADADGTLWMHGTPWHGEAHASLQGRVRVERVFLLEQAEVDEATEVEPFEAVRRLLSHAMMAHFWPSAVERTLDEIGRLVETIPVDNLRFTKSAAAVHVARTR